MMIGRMAEHFELTIARYQRAGVPSAKRTVVLLVPIESAAKGRDPNWLGVPGVRAGAPLDTPPYFVAGRFPIEACLRAARMTVALMHGDHQEAERIGSEYPAPPDAPEVPGAGDGSPG